MVGEQLFYGKGAGKEPTASAVIGDIIETARNVTAGEAGQGTASRYPENWKAPGRVMDMKEITTKLLSQGSSSGSSGSAL